MADVAENLRTFTLGGTAIAGIVADRMSQDHVPEKFEGHRIWFGRSGTVSDDCIDMTADDNTIQENYDVECVSDDIVVAQTLADAVKDRLNGYRGTFGTQTIQGCFCTDHNDDYIPRSVYSDDGLFVAAMNVEVFPQ